MKMGNNFPPTTTEVENNNLKEEKGSKDSPKKYIKTLDNNPRMYKY